MNFFFLINFLTSADKLLYNRRMEGMMRKELDTSILQWKNKPNNYVVGRSRIIFETMPYTDLWSRTLLGTIKNNAHSITFKIEQNFTFSCKVNYHFKKEYDQAGLVIYANDDNWFKICVEYIDEQHSLLTTVVTYHGFSDCSTTSIGSAVETMWFRVTHYNENIVVENSFDGIHYKQMRIFHMKFRGDKFEVGMFAASPKESSFDVIFEDMIVEDCIIKEENIRY